MRITVEPFAPLPHKPNLPAIEENILEVLTSQPQSPKAFRAADRLRLHELFPQRQLNRRGLVLRAPDGIRLPDGLKKTGVISTLNLSIHVEF